MEMTMIKNTKKGIDETETDFGQLSACYIRHYTDFIENTPLDIQRNLTQLLEINIKLDAILNKLEKVKHEVTECENVTDLKKLLLKMQSLLMRTQELKEKQMEFSDSIVNIVRNSECQLEEDMKKLENALQDMCLDDRSLEEKMEFCVNKIHKKTDVTETKIGNSTRRHSDVSTHDGSLHEMQNMASTPNANNKNSKRGRKRIQKKNLENSDPSDCPDRDEKSYCLCNQGFHSDMIACDNRDCEIEWYHFACVDLDAEPKGEWICPRCRNCVCNRPVPSPMIACDNPECPIEWYHFSCVDLKTEPKGKWYCPRCIECQKNQTKNIKQARSKQNTPI